VRVRLPRLDRTTVTFTVSALVLAVGYWALVGFAERMYTATSPTPSVTNDGPAGLSVYYRYLGELGIRTRTLGRFDQLPVGATIVAAGPFEAPPTDAEKQRVAAWVRSGGRLVVVGTEARSLLEGLELKGVPGEAATDTPVAPSVPTVYAAGVGRIRPGTDRIGVQAPEWVAHYADGDGAAVVSAVEGTGEVVWLAGSGVVANQGIGEADNARLAVLLAAAGDRPVYFDEYHLGFADDASLWTRLGPGGQGMAILVAVATLALLVARGRRLGPALPPREEPLARGAAYIGSLAELYRKAGARAEALEVLEDGLTRALARRHGTVESGLTRRPQAREALERSRVLRRGDSIVRDEFMAAARLIRRARREVEGRDG